MATRIDKGTGGQTCQLCKEKIKKGASHIVLNVQHDQRFHIICVYDAIGRVKEFKKVKDVPAMRDNHGKIRYDRHGKLKKNMRRVPIGNIVRGV